MEGLVKEVVKTGKVKKTVIEKTVREFHLNKQDLVKIKERQDLLKGEICDKLGKGKHEVDGLTVINNVYQSEAKSYKYMWELAKKELPTVVLKQLESIENDQTKFVTKQRFEVK